MNTTRNFLFAITALCLGAGAFSCQQAGGNQTGSEFIPDMAHSIAYEANYMTHYSYNSWDKESTVSLYDLSQPRLPVAGTIPRGYTGIASNDGTFSSAESATLDAMSKMQSKGGGYTLNGHVPYYFPDTDEGRKLAEQKLIYNPFPITKAGLERGQGLYTIYCGICHGKDADGNGDITTTGKYPPQPANLVDSTYSNGRIYHTIMYGKNTMGPYADKLSYVERWEVIHYIRSLQAKKGKVKYDEETNQLNGQFGVPFAKVKGTGGASVPGAPENIMSNEELKKKEIQPGGPDEETGVREQEPKKEGH